MMRWRLCGALLAAAWLSACSAYDQYLKRGDELAKSGQFESADREYDRAIALDPRRPEAPARRKTVRDAWASDLHQRGQVALAAGKLDEAIDLYVRALRVDPEHPEALTALGSALDAKVELAKVELSAGRLESAMDQVERVLHHAPSHAGALARRQDIRGGFARRHFAQGESYEKVGKLGNAMIEFLRADQALVGATAARERLDTARRKVLDEITFFIHATPVDDQTKSADLALRLGAGRLAVLVPERLPIRVITQPPPSPTGVRVMLSLERVLTVTDKQVIQKTQRYLQGMRSIPNPKRVQYEQALLEAERTLEDSDQSVSAQMRAFLNVDRDLEVARSLVDSCHKRTASDCQRAFLECAQAPRPPDSNQAMPPECRPERCALLACEDEKRRLEARRADSDTARAALDAALLAADRQRKAVQRSRDAVFREPVTVDEPMHADFVYDVEVHKFSVRASVTYRLEDLAAQPVASTPYSQDFIVTSEDETHRGYDRYGVLTDPLQLKNEQELRLEVGDKALTEILGKVRVKFNAYRSRLLEDARRGLVRAAAEDVAERMVRALLATADAPPKDLLAALSTGRKLNDPLGLLLPLPNNARPGPSRGAH